MTNKSRKALEEAAKDAEWNEPEAGIKADTVLADAFRAMAINLRTQAKQPDDEVVEEILARDLLPKLKQYFRWEITDARPEYKEASELSVSSYFVSAMLNKLRELHYAEWRPIETCPDNIDAILGLCPDTYAGQGQFITECHWGVSARNIDDGGWWEQSDKNRVYPTHWKPLPSKAALAALGQKEPKQCIERVADVIRNAVEMTDKQYIWRRTSDKKAYEVIYWPNPEVAANEEWLGYFTDRDDAEKACEKFRAEEVAKAAIAAYLEVKGEKQ